MSKFQAERFAVPTGLMQCQACKASTRVSRLFIPG